MPTAALVAGAGLQAGGQIMGGIQQQEEAGNEAKQLQQQGQTEATRAGAQISSNDVEARRALGSLNTGAAASGVTPGSGSVKAVRSMNESMAILKDTYSRYQGTMAENNAYYQARSAKYAGNQALWGGVLSAGSSLLTAGFNANQMGKGVGTPTS